ncbi:MAG: hypothetical protein H7Z40_06905 [Phycisphaerae bacterium]|nr:hypothetical protein [Gemmatimonadaceae bacterium]
MSPNDPADSGPVIARAALERVLARATELQAENTDAPEGISEERLVEIGREVGIPAEHLRLALAEERSRSPYADAEQGPLLDGLGVVQISAQRSVAGTPTELLANLDAWMKREEGLDGNRRATNRLTWSPRNGPLSFIYNAIGRSGRSMELVRTDEVSATVTSIDAARAVVRLDADLTRLRRTQRNVMIGVGVVANAGVFAALSGIILLVVPEGGAPIVGGLAVAQSLGGYGLWRLLKGQYRKSMARVHQKLEQLLDHVEHGAMVTRPTLIGQLRDAMLEAATPLRGILPPTRDK